MKDTTADIAVIGGGLGGVAASLAAADAGWSVLLTEETDRLGGQVTSQGVSALDEHPHIEYFGGTSSYYSFREGIRDFYQRRYGAPETMPDGKPLNPGNGWVSRLCFEPKVGRQVIQEMLSKHIVDGRITVLTGYRPIDVGLSDGHIRRVALIGDCGDTVEIEAGMYLDATELGDLLPLSGAAYVTGAEARANTGEPHARPDGPRLEEVQALTFSFAVEYRPGEDHTIDEPPNYELWRDEYDFTLEIEDAAGSKSSYRMFERGPTGLPPFWTYRRLRDGRLLGLQPPSGDIVLINWASHDYRGASILDVSPKKRGEIFEQARQLSLAFLHWLQTEVPRDDGTGYGYPGLRLVPESTETEDGVAAFPYVRESRRLKAQTRVCEQDVLWEGGGTPRARTFPGSVGVGLYQVDVHASVGNPRSMYAPAVPFQIPLGALVSEHPVNLLAAAKNIGTTHLTNGCYRVHPVEWNVGEAAGCTAAYCLENGLEPKEILDDQRHLRRCQLRLLDRGVPIFWLVDIPSEHPAFVPAQMLALAGAIENDTARRTCLKAYLDKRLTRDEAFVIVEAVKNLAVDAGVSPNFGPLNLWRGQPSDPVSAAEIASLLDYLGAYHAELPDSPSWGDLCTGLVQPLRWWFQRP